MSWSSGDDLGDGAAVPSHGVAARRLAVRQAVVDVVRNRPALVDDVDLLDGYLRDVCPSQPAEVAVVVVAARGGVPEELVHASEGHHAEAMAARLASRLNEESGIDQVLARWAVDTWATALGRSKSPAQPAFTDSMPVTAVPAPPAPAPAPPAGGADGMAPTAAPPAGPAHLAGQDSMPVTAAPPPAPAGAGDALRAMVSPVTPSKNPAPAPLSDNPTLVPAAPAVPPKTRTRASPPAPPTPPPTPAPRRGRPGRRGNIVLAGSVVAALVAVALVVTASQDDGTETAGSSTDATQVAESTSTSLGPTTSTVPPKPFPSSRGALTPGTYATTSFAPAMTMALTGAWEMLTPETSEFYELRRVESPIARVSVMHLTEVFQAGAAIRSSADIRRAGAVEPVPGDVAGWLAANPNLSVGPRSPVRTPAVSGSRFEVTVPTGYETSLCGGSRCVPLWPFKNAKPNEIGQLGPTLRHLVYALDAGDRKVLVIIATPPEDNSAFLPEAERLIATLRFTG